MAKLYKIKSGKLLISQEIEIIDCAMYLKYDWHLYNLSKDIRNSRDSHFRRYLKKATELFADKVSKSKPNNRVDLFGCHSVFYYLYGHTSDWVVAARAKATLLKDMLNCVSGDNLNRMLDIVQHSTDQMEAEEHVCSAFGVQPASASKILSLSVNKLASIEEDVLRAQYEQANAFLQKVIELEQYDRKH